MEEKRFWITNRFGEKLEILLRKPVGNKKFPAILFVSGLNQDLHEDENSFDEISKLLVKNNFLTIQFSFAGRGNSEGDYKEMTFERQARQIEDIFQEIQSYDFVDKNHIGIAAQSCGAPSFLLTNLSEVKSILFISGEFNTYKNLRRKFTGQNAYNPTGLSIYPHSNNTKTCLNRTFWDSLSHYEETKHLKKVTVPVFVAQGTKDDYVSSEDAKQAFEFLPHPKKQLKIYPEGTHGLGGPQNVHQELLQDIVAWFKQTLL